MIKTYSQHMIRFVCWYGIASILCLVFFIYFTRPSSRNWFLRGLLFGNSVTSTIIVAVANEFEVKTDRIKKEERA